MSAQRRQKDSKVPMCWEGHFQKAGKRAMEGLRQQMKGQRPENKLHLDTLSVKDILHTDPMHFGKNGYLEIRENISA